MERISDGRDATAEVHPDNLVDCTMRFLGRKKEFHGLPVGTVVVKTFTNCVKPSIVKLEKVE